MAIETIDTGVSDAEMFRSTMEPEPAATPDPAPEPEGRPRDEQGRFAPTQAQPEPVTAPAQAQPTQAQPDPTKPDDGANVPSWRLREVREAREAADNRALEAERRAYALEQRISQFEQANKPKPAPVDFFADPEQALQQRIGPMQDEFAKFKSDLVLETSRELAMIRHGEKAVTEMETAIQEQIARQNPEMIALSAQMRSSRNPAAIAMQWHQRHKLVNETGGDLAVYRQKILDDAMKDPAFQAKVLEASRGIAQQAAAQPGASPNIKLPPSLNKTTGAGISAALGGDDDVSDGALFRHAVAGKPGRR